MASSVGIVGFARGASTDMQLAAPFCVGMLGWYAWYEDGQEILALRSVLFRGLCHAGEGTDRAVYGAGDHCGVSGVAARAVRAEADDLAAGGGAVSADGVAVVYCGAAAQSAVLPRVFHSAQSGAVRHESLPAQAALVLLWRCAGAGDDVRGRRWRYGRCGTRWETSIAEWKARRHPQRYVGHVRAGDAFPEFLVLWAAFPIVFFSFSGSKLPGYILPSIPPLAILTGDYLFRMRRRGLPNWLLVMHAAITGFLTFVLLLCPQYMVYARLIPRGYTFAWTSAVGVVSAAAVVLVVRWFGVERLRAVTLVPMALCLFFLLGVNGRVLDLNYSARPLAKEIAATAPEVHDVAMLDVRRDLRYGVAFYRNQAIGQYKQDGVPDEEHVLVVPTRETPALEQWLQGRAYERLFFYPTQGLSVYKVMPRGGE